jgi:hypothetical protein
VFGFLGDFGGFLKRVCDPEISGLGKRSQLEID